MIILKQKTGWDRAKVTIRRIAGSALVRIRWWLTAIGLLAVLAAVPAGAQDNVEQSGGESGGTTVSQPEPKPQMLIAKPEINPLLPRPRPDPGSVVPPAAPASTASVPNQLTTGTIVPAEGGEQEACLWRLRALGVATAQQPPIDEGDGCRVASPLVVSELSLDISVYPDATLTCAAAEAMTRWMHEVVVPAAREHLDAEPTGLTHSSAYACSGPGSAAAADEHASGNAVDITGIIFKGRSTLVIGKRDSDTDRERAFQQAVRSGACRYFSNVLGPGAEAGFDGKLHLGAAPRTEGAWICK